MRRIMVNDLLSLTSEQLMDRMGQVGSRATIDVMAELSRRQTEAQISSALWMKLSVVTLTLATIINIAVQIWLQISN